MIDWISRFILGYFTVLWFCYTILFIMSIPRIIRKFQEINFSNIMKDLVYPKDLAVTVMMPVHNYEKRIGLAIDSILNNLYPNTYLIVINDGSTDETLKHLIKRYHLELTTQSSHYRIPTSRVKNIYQSTQHPHFVVINKEHEQKISSAADCLNSGLNFCRTPLCVTIDADTIITPDTIPRLIYRYLTTPHCVAVGGNIFIPDEPKKKKPLLKKIPNHPTLGVQVVEYLRSFIYGHEFWSPIGGALCHSGALTLFETSRLIELGGFDTDNYSYDAEIIMRIHDNSLTHDIPYRIRYAPSAIAWSAQPTTIKGLWAQRQRWQRGLLRSLSHHAHMLFNPRYGRVGLLGMPFYTLFEIFGPVVEGTAYITAIIAWCLQVISGQELVWLLLLAWAYIFILSVSSLLIHYLTLNEYHHKRDLFKLLWLNAIDVLFYRPLRSFCALFSTIEYVINRLKGKPL